MGLIKKLRKAKKECEVNEKPATVKTHLRNMIVVPEMIGSVVGIYNGKTFNTVEIKPEMTGHYLAEFSMSYVPDPVSIVTLLYGVVSSSLCPSPGASWPGRPPFPSSKSAAKVELTSTSHIPCHHHRTQRVTGTSPSDTDDPVSDPPTPPDTFPSSKRLLLGKCDRWVVCLRCDFETTITLRRQTKRERARERKTE